MVVTWDDSDEESTDEKHSLEVLNLTLMSIGNESFDEHDEVSDLPSSDELFEAFNKLDNDLKKIGLKNASLKKKHLEFSNENGSLNAKVKCLEIKDKNLHGEIMSFKEKQSIALEHENSLINDLIKENKTRKKKSNELKGMF